MIFLPDLHVNAMVNPLRNAFILGFPHIKALLRTIPQLPSNVI